MLCVITLEENGGFIANGLAVEGDEWFGQDCGSDRDTEGQISTVMELGIARSQINNNVCFL